jgi:RNA polymerase sigma-70 factor (ECF subfamily)
VIAVLASHRTSVPVPRETQSVDLAQAALEGLMEAYVNGNAAAFELLYQRISGRLFGYLLRLTRHRERAEDLLQTTFSKLHRARAAYLVGAPLLPWVFAIARRTFLDEQRRMKHRKEDLSADGTLPEPRVVQHEPVELSAALESALQSLPETYREAIVLTKITGLSVADAAQVLGSTPSAVKLRVHRGYKELRKTLNQYNRAQ